jgi:predicted MFS family arabinose efflux permease
VMSMTYSAALIAGFGCGGLLVALVGPRSSLGVDAATFAVSALLIRSGVRSREPLAPQADNSPGPRAISTFRLVFTSPLVRPLVAVAWLSALWMTPEALAAPYAAALGRGHSAVGLLMAAMPTGTVIGGFLAARFLPPAKRWVALTPMGLFSSAALATCLIHPSLWLTCTLWMLCGLGTSYNLAANAAFVEVIPNASRSQAFALVATGMVTGEGVAALAAGAASSVLAPATVVGIAGVLGLVAFTALRLTWLRRPQSSAVVDGLPMQPDSPAVRGVTAA